MLKKHPHTPAHLFLDDTPYFITGTIYNKRHLLANSELKGMLLEKIQFYFQKYEWQLNHWVILDNHYHLLGMSSIGSDLKRLIKGIHGSTASTICTVTKCAKPIWWNYWDYCPRDEREYNVRLNYLLWNPVKHGYVDDLKLYRFSSFQIILDEMGEERLKEQFRKYPEYKNLVLKEVENDDF